MEERKLIAKVIDAETGEIINDLYEGDKIISPYQQDNNQIKNYNGDKRFVKLFDGTEELHRLLKNDGVFSTAIRLSKYVCYDDCVLRTNGHKNGNVLDVHELSELMKIPYNTLRKHISVLYKNGVLALCKTGTKGNPDLINDCIIANPDVFMRGSNVNKTVLSIFQEAGWDDYKSLSEE